jgi:hypothetical protein
MVGMAAERYKAFRDHALVGIVTMTRGIGTFAMGLQAADSDSPTITRIANGVGTLASVLPILGPGMRALGAIRGSSGVVLYHETDISTARALLMGAELEVGAAAARSTGASPGFYLATQVDDATHFAYTRSPGGILKYELSAEAIEQLVSAGTKIGKIKSGPKGYPVFQGKEFVVPTKAFEIFNSLRKQGLINVGPL